VPGDQRIDLFSTNLDARQHQRGRSSWIDICGVSESAGIDRLGTKNEESYRENLSSSSGHKPYAGSGDAPVSEWLSQEPAGAARDAGAQEIINQIKDTDPERLR